MPPPVAHPLLPFQVVSATTCPPSPVSERTAAGYDVLARGGVIDVTPVVARRISSPMIASGTKHGDAEIGRIDERLLEGGKALRGPRVFGPAPTDGNDGRRILFVVHSRGDSVQKPRSELSAK